ncbi:hypothetical protein B1J93_16470 [Leptospira kirschneri serovar Pomona]|uniref:Uncharacterized protein n=1 Tax=Leptospira kirschneri serovar Pomona TaxID=561005 RepID=A0A1T1DIK8_9LEPT|nr:hypothetical protein B1J93_16470 [Leptospira kirschneri serovar Pomona]OOV50053.1 hypothetical protein B1J94_02540 [Leptospira kirschneri serovar Grippotyphosa]
MHKRNVIRYFDLSFNLFTSHRSLSRSFTLKKENFPILKNEIGSNPDYSSNLKVSYTFQIKYFEVF